MEAGGREWEAGRGRLEDLKKSEYRTGNEVIHTMPHPLQFLGGSFHSTGLLSIVSFKNLFIHLIYLKGR